MSGGRSDFFCRGCNNFRFGTLSQQPSTSLMSSTRRGCIAVLALSVSLSQAFYLPGSAPRDYSVGEKVDVFVNALTPVIGPEAKLVCFRTVIRGLGYTELIQVWQ